MSTKKMIVVGGVAAGMSAAAKARRTDPDLEIAVYEKTGHVSYGACSFPYFLGGVFSDPARLIARTPAQFAAQGIQVHLRHEVLHIDPQQRCVLVRDLNSGREFADQYDVLILTTGGSSIRPPLPGLDLEGIFTLRTVEDTLAIKAWLQERQPQQGVIVGAGYIGLEMADALVSQGVEVSMVEMLPQAMPNTDPEIGALIGEELARHGVNLYVNTRLERFEGEAGRISAAVAGHRILPADIAIMAVGIRPSVHLAVEAGIDLGLTGAVAVDDHQRTSVPGIYAAGDVAEALDLVTGKPAWVPLATTANKQGKVAGENAAGGDAAFKGIVGTGVVRIFELEVARTGLTELAARDMGYDVATTLVRHDSQAGYMPGAEPITLKLVFERRDGRLLGAQMAGRDGVGKRIDTLAAALHAGWTVSELAALDLAYAPPFSPTYDITLIAASQALKKVASPT